MPKTDAKKGAPRLAESPEPPQSADGLRGRDWKRFVSGPAGEILKDLYEPALARAVLYDRCCAYFSSSVLAAAAAGFGALIDRLVRPEYAAARPSVRLVVNEQLSEEDVRAMTETGDVSQLEALLLKKLKTPKDALEKDQLGMLAWLVKRGLLEVRVGVMRHGEGIVHAKFGVMTDERGDAVVFSGSGNESASGLAGNYERLEVSTSWEDPDRHREYSTEFDLLWTDRHSTVHTVPLPEAVRLKLIRFAPKEPLFREPALAHSRQKAAMVWEFIREAPYLPNGALSCDATAMVDLWPHQRRVVEETAEAWPDGRLLCDEVGMGKTIEAMLVLRRLLAGRGVRRALLLLPAGLLKQWQAELREKGGMVFPRLEGTAALVWPDDRVQKVKELAEALREDVLLVSRETARTENNLGVLLEADPWDLVVLDESHAARRRKPEAGEFNSGTLLLELLRKLQLFGRARGFLLLSATPMQMHPWEPWDLISVLGEGGAWLSDFAGVEHFFEAVAHRSKGPCLLPTAERAARVIAADPAFPPPPDAAVMPASSREIARKIAFAPKKDTEKFTRWLRHNSPLWRRMHRNTRKTLRGYHAMGLLDQPPPLRVVEDVRFDFEAAEERSLYDSVTDYVEKRFKELEAEKPGKGFVMTVYRRRAASSPLAFEESLKRRAEGLRRVAGRLAYDDEYLSSDLDQRDLDDLGELDDLGKISSALPVDPEVARRELGDVQALLDQLRRLGGRDSKRDRFFDELRRVTDDGRAVLIFTEYLDTLAYLRDELVGFYGKRLGCYSGDGGEVWDGQRWDKVTKDVITDELKAGRLQALVCTDAASEGLNLQAASAVINYDLPWNPSKVEQRIGRVDRIGQRSADVRVINMFLKDSVDDQVYGALRRRCGLFEHFVGPMQPVLALARPMLLGKTSFNDLAISEAVSGIGSLAAETYVEGEASPDTGGPPPVSRLEVRKALESLSEAAAGVTARPAAKPNVVTVSGPEFRSVSFGSAAETLEHDPELEPLSPLSPLVARLAEALVRPGELLPLAIGSHQNGGFRRSVALWVSERTPEPVPSLQNLKARLESWNGAYPDPSRRFDAEEQARAQARAEVEAMRERALQREAHGREQQVEAARLRLRRELGRYLVSVDPTVVDFNGLLHKQLGRDFATASRLRKVLELLAEYPVWPEDLKDELREFAQSQRPSERKGRVIGKEIDAAIADPRWSAAMPLTNEEAQTA